MPRFSPRATRLALALAACAAAAGCGTFDKASLVVADAVTPYRIEIIQGNFVSKEQVEALRKGLSRQQVREALGTPLLQDLFHANRWDYVFTIKRQGVEPQARRLTVYFAGDTLERWEGDAMPGEADFVATLDNKRKDAAIPPLEASEDKLKEFAPARPPETAPQPAPALSNYPPLEPAR